MNRMACICVAVLTETIPFPSQAIDLSWEHSEAIAELQSYGERATELNDLLMPFLAKRNFARDRPTLVSDSGIFQAVFSNDASGDPARGDAVVVTGKFNCLTVTYYSALVGRTHTQQEIVDPKGAHRASDLLLAMKNYLGTLPYPRLTMTGIALGSKPACANSF